MEKKPKLKFRRAFPTLCPIFGRHRATIITGCEGCNDLYTFYAGAVG